MKKTESRKGGEENQKEFDNRRGKAERDERFSLFSKIIVFDKCQYLVFISIYCFALLSNIADNNVTHK